ncbi:MAG: alternative ribosome rescue aminoacyl-tRNA hydrolase ArfB [Planctomycetota bacterium]
MSADAAPNPSTPKGAPPPLDEANGLRLGPGVVLPRSAVRWKFARSGGPGGQNVNKVSSKAVLEVDWSDLAAVLSPGVLRRLRAKAKRYLAGEGDALRIRIPSESSRKQSDNRRVCEQKLAELVLASLTPPKVRKKTRPTLGSKKRRLEAKKQRGQVKRNRGRPSNDH